jgi:CubicO group peptidase (beta-lactamase class C family)
MSVTRFFATVASIAAVVSLASVVPAAGCSRQAAPPPPVVAPTPAPPSPPPVPDHFAFVAAVDALAAEELARGPIAGLSIAVFQHGKPIVAKGYGFADAEAGVPATADTSYPIASVSKHFTAAMILRLADQGRLSLDDPLSRFFPEARARIGALTLRHLLDHTSGLTRGGPAPRAAALSVITRGGTARGQGDAWDYSNYNFSLLGLVIEQVTGKDYAAYVRDDVAAPLGLTGTGYCEDGTSVPGRGRDYLSSTRSFAPTDYWTKAKFFASGGLCSTVLDLVRWEQALEAGRVVSPAMLQAMRTPALLSGPLAADYGLGTRLGQTGTHRKLGHTGGGQGNKAVFARYPDDDVTIAVLFNTERADGPVTANELEELIARQLFSSADAATPDVAVSQEELQRYEGQYRDAGQLVRLTSRDGALTMRPGRRHRPESRFVGVGHGVFVMADDPTAALRFEMGDVQARAYARYRNGWFNGLAVRTGEPAAPARSLGR